MFHLYTAHGTLVFVDDATGRLRHGPIGEAPANLIAERDGSLISLAHLAADGARGAVALGAERCGTAGTVAPRRLQERRQTAARSTLFADGRCLSAAGDGSITFDQTVALDAETFLLLTPAGHADLRTFLTERWVSASARRVLRPEECVALPRFAVRVRSFETDLEDLLAQLRPSGAAPLAERSELALRSEGWRLDRLHRFRPLAYMTVFGSEATFAAAWLTIGSLLQHGNWPGDILLITDAAHADLAERLPAELRARIHMVGVQADDALDQAFARYRITELPIAAGYQPILYLGGGTVCDAPLDGLLAGLATSERLHTGPERLLLSEDDAYGRTLLLRDGYADQGTAIGFSSGVFGFRATRDVAKLFADIMACGYGFAEQEQTRTFFAMQDQPFANYVLTKAGIFDMSLIFAHRSTPPTGPEDAGTRKGMLRFVAPPGGEEALLRGMRDYLAHIGR